MWGLKNCMQYLVPEEKLKLTREDCLQMSKGMKIGPVWQAVFLAYKPAVADLL
jgi:hypothetical protein